MSKSQPVQPFLKGAQIHLRGLQRDDIEGPWFNWFNDQQNTYFMSNGTYPSSLEMHTAYYDQIVRSKDNLVLAICLNDDKRHVGNIGLHGINWLNRKVEIGIIVGDTSVHGRGIATEAIRLICGHAFDRLNLHKIYARTETDNIASVKAFKKAGFREEGILRQEARHHGKWHDSVYLGLLEDDFRRQAKQ